MEHVAAGYGRLMTTTPNEPIADPEVTPGSDPDASPHPVGPGAEPEPVGPGADPDTTPDTQPQTEL